MCYLPEAKGVCFAGLEVEYEEVILLSAKYDRRLR